jgi:hypothetical protein
LSVLPLRLGPLSAEGFNVQRSGIRWLCEDGHLCRPGEVIAYCSIGLRPVQSIGRDAAPFASEARDLQVAFASTIGGRLRRSAGTSLGGFLDQHHFHQRWLPDFVIGHIYTAPTGEDAAARPGDVAAASLRLLMLAGRRTTELAEVRSGLLTGWHDRSRAWWGETEGLDENKRGTLLSLGICEQSGVMRGEQFAFTEMFEAVAGPAQAVFVADDALVPCARVTLEQLRRTPADNQAIAESLARSLLAGSVAPTPGDWIFVGALLSALARSPLADSYDLLTRGGLRHAGPADAVSLSLGAESPVILKHRHLGYAINCHGFRIAESGPAVRTWLRSEFEPLRRGPDEIKRDYIDLIDAVREHSNAKILVYNVMSTSGHEDVSNYASFDRPMRESLASIRNKELNLMLHDLSRERDIAIVDIDAIAAELGAAAHLPDGVHNSGPMQREVRTEILRILRDLGVPGFGAIS